MDDENTKSKKSGDFFAKIKEDPKIKAKIKQYEDFMGPDDALIEEELHNELLAERSPKKAHK